MNERDNLHSKDDLNRASEHLDRAGDHAGSAAHHTKEALEAGASGTIERTKDVARDAGRAVGHAADRAADAVGDAARTAGHVAGRVANAEADVELEHRADSKTENALHKAGDAIQGAAPTIGRGVEATVSAAGAAISAVSGPLGMIVGKIAGRVGGWWNSAAKAIAELPEEEERACRVHFEAYTMRPAGMTYERALPGYALGYVAARNPDYRGRSFQEIEPDLRHGFDKTGDDYDALRGFTEYGYERGMNRP